MTYRAIVRRHGMTLAETASVQVAPDATSRGTLTFVLPDYGFGQRIDLLLMRGDETEPYRRLQLVIDVPPPDSTAPIQALQTPVARR